MRSVDRYGMGRRHMQILQAKPGRESGISKKEGEPMRYLEVEGFSKMLKEQMDWDRQAEESAIKSRKYETCIEMESSQSVYRWLLDIINGSAEHLTEELGEVPRWILDEE